MNIKFKTFINLIFVYARIFTVFYIVLPLIKNVLFYMDRNIRFKIVYNMLYRYSYNILYIHNCFVRP